MNYRVTKNTQDHNGAGIKIKASGLFVILALMSSTAVAQTTQIEPSTTQALPGLVSSDDTSALKSGNQNPSQDASTESDLESGGFIINGGQRGDWAFMMGPSKAPDMTLKLIRANKDHSGAIGFMCSRRDGSMQLAVVIPGAQYKLDEQRDLDLTVGDQKNKLRVVVHDLPKPGQDPVFETSGVTGPNPVPNILQAMSTVDENRNDAVLRFDAGNGHSASFGLTKPRNVAAETAEICLGWAGVAKELQKLTESDENHSLESSQVKESKPLQSLLPDVKNDITVGPITP